MSHQQFFETVQREEEWRDMWCKKYLKESAEDMYCPYCLTLQGEKIVCCKESDFVPLKHLPLEDQMEIISNEYDNAYQRTMK